MMEEHQDNKGYQRITIWDHLYLVLRYKKLFFTVLTVMAISSVTFSFLTHKWYKSEGELLPPPQMFMGLGDLVPNLDMGILGGLGAIPTEAKLILTILDSRRMKDMVIDHFDWMRRHKLKNRKKAYDKYKKLVDWEITEDGAVRISVQERTPEIASETVNFIQEQIIQQYNIVSASQARNQREFMEKRLDEVMADLKDSEENFRAFMKESGVISVEDQIRATVDAIAQLKTQLILAEVEKDVVEGTMPKDASVVIQAQKTVQSLNSQLHKLLKRDESALNDAIIGMDVAPDYAIQYLRLQRDIELNTSILEFLLPMYEQARITEKRERSNVYILDSGNVPDKKHKPKRAFIVIAWMFITFVLLYLFVQFLAWRERLQTVDPDYARVVDNVIDGFKPKNLFK